MKNRKGISLIVLVITIIVIIILAGAVILSLSNNNPIKQATESTFKASVDAYNSELTMTLSNQYVNNTSFNPNAFNASTWNGGSTIGTIKQYIPSITDVDAKKFEIQKGKLVYVGDDTTEQSYITNMGLPNKSVVAINTIAMQNATINGSYASYNNPIIPKGFKAVNTTAVWPTDWNKGLVIEDASGNQFVWVPVDGTNVKYEKWCTLGLPFGSATDDTLPTSIKSELDQITNYGGFYIARYEAMFDYNGGNIRAASKKSTNKLDAVWTRDAAHTGYLWNYTSYTDAKTYSESMAISYGYDTNNVVTNLVTGTEWDAVMKWAQNTGYNIVDSRAWGNHNNSIAPANVAGFGSLQISGFSEQWKANNIYDLSGNPWEWTNEKTATMYILRGGSFVHDGTIYSAAHRLTYAISTALHDFTFRTALYIK